MSIHEARKKENMYLLRKSPLKMVRFSWKNKTFENSSTIHIIPVCDTHTKNSETMANGIIAVIFRHQKNFSKNSPRNRARKNERKKYLAN